MPQLISLCSDEHLVGVESKIVKDRMLKKFRVTNPIVADEKEREMRRKRGGKGERPL